MEKYGQVCRQDYSTNINQHQQIRARLQAPTSAASWCLTRAEAASALTAPVLTPPASPAMSAERCSKKGVRLAQNIPVGPCIPVGMQLAKAGVGPTTGPTRRLSHLLTQLIKYSLVLVNRLLAQNLLALDVRSTLALWHTRPS
jgi:hypothetical protein